MRRADFVDKNFKKQANEPVPEIPKPNLKYKDPLDFVRPSYHASKTVMMKRTTFRKPDPKEFEPTWEELQIEKWK